MSRLNFACRIALFIVLFLVATTSIAQEFDDDVQDEYNQPPVTPIDDVIWVGISAAAILGYLILSNKKNPTTSSN